MFTIITGAQFGDEGKGKIVDVLGKDYDLVVRFQGGNNAGHTVIVGDDTYKLHLIPSHRCPAPDRSRRGCRSDSTYSGDRDAQKCWHRDNP